ncbi:nucleolar protein 12-domain-containing protein [Glomus cerebriforme]|uniref:Nucleolar protein 12-domain-containing protein n=1 Tax=Glomus cerebriforme TaxID=658196 RepID=A0A397T6W4_9GLOM|nr:nucleolar protein 12-domain-containing protein [Glomus cerebriforme]
MDNLTVLTEGSKIYAKKRKNRIEQVPEVVFDETARREFLTGFHKRKLERKAKAKESALQFSKQERAKARKAAKESVKEQIKQRLAKLQDAINKRNGIIGCESEKEEEETNNSDNEKNNNKEPNVIQTEFRSPDNTKTTVTIIEDFNISDTLGNVSKKPRIDEEVISRNKEISSVPIKKSEQKSTITSKKSEKAEKVNKKKRQPRNKTRRSKTKKSKSGLKRRK